MIEKILLNKANGSAGGICLSGWQIRLSKILYWFLDVTVRLFM